MELVRCADAEEVATRAARAVAEVVRPGAQICLAGGSSPMRAYELLDAMDLAWEGVDLWYGDERCVPADHPDSNHGQARARLRAPGAVWHPMPGERGPDTGPTVYADELGSAIMTLTLLGMGPDGHTCSLFPEHPLLDATGTVAGLTDSPKPPPERITLTLPMLNASLGLLLLVTGAEKAGALARVLDEPGRATPASLLARDRLTILADAAALGG
ncbi:MAG TPA: 6-phosphogluconolactonase [Baekduia sp.]|nr:6-phosphogluconolactonase [Baekduia sp.]